MANPIPPEHTDSVLILTEDIKEGFSVYATDGTNTEKYIVGPVTLIEYTDLDTNTTIWYHELPHNFGTVPTHVWYRDSMVSFNDSIAVEGTSSVDSAGLATINYDAVNTGNTREITTEVISNVRNNSIHSIQAMILREG